MEDKEDGGYYAVKGFLFQYDKSIIELLENPEKEIYLEQIQDINYENYVLQVKHKETQEFSNSKVKEPIIKLLRLYKENRNQKYCLYAYFKDRKPETVTYKNISDIRKVIGYRDVVENDKIQAEFEDELLQSFIINFKLEFSFDYIHQFELVINKIREYWGIGEDEAYIHHSIIREYLFNIVVSKTVEERKVTLALLKNHIDSCKKITINSYYEEFLGHEKYIQMLKKSFFTAKKSNINNFERLFIFECSGTENEGQIRKLVELIKMKFYKKNKSPAPYVLFRRIRSEVLIQVKQGLVDDDINFSDGTCFDGDRFRIEKITKKDNDVKLKIVKEDNIDEIVSAINFKEVYNLFIDEKKDIMSNAINYDIKITNCSDAIYLVQ